MTIDLQLMPLEPSPVHLGWKKLATALRHAGVAPELTLDSLAGRLGAQAPREPSPTNMLALLKGYFQGDGDEAVGLERQHAARLFVHHAQHPSTASGLVTRLGALTTELTGLSLLAEAGSGLLYLWSDDKATFLQDHEVIVDQVTIDGATHRRRTVTVEGLVGAANRLLAMNGLDFRYVPLATTDELEVYVGVSANGAAILHMVDALDDDWSELEELMCFTCQHSETLQSVA